MCRNFCDIFAMITSFQLTWFTIGNKKEEFFRQTFVADWSIRWQNTFTVNFISVWPTQTWYKLGVVMYFISPFPSFRWFFATPAHNNRVFSLQMQLHHVYYLQRLNTMLKLFMQSKYAIFDDELDFFPYVDLFNWTSLSKIYVTHFFPIS